MAEHVVDVGAVVPAAGAAADGAEFHPGAAAAGREANGLVVVLRVRPCRGERPRPGVQPANPADPAAAEPHTAAAVAAANQRGVRRDEDVRERNARGHAEPLQLVDDLRECVTNEPET